VKLYKAKDIHSAILVMNWALNGTDRLNTDTEQMRLLS